MPGFQRTWNKNKHGKEFPCSQYHDPRGGRPSALEMNILRYRAYEVSLFLFYAEDLKRFMLENVYPLVSDSKSSQMAKGDEEKKLVALVKKLVLEAQLAKIITKEDEVSICKLVGRDNRDGVRLKMAFSHAVSIGLCTEQIASEAQELICYRNDIAHRTHKITADISRNSAALDYLSIYESGYQAHALDRLRKIRSDVQKKSNKLNSYVLSMSPYIFEFAERFYKVELERLDCVIRRQAKAENKRMLIVRVKVKRAREIFTGNLEPRHPKNFQRPTLVNRDEYRYSNRLSARGVEVCYRMFDTGLENLVISYLMGLTLRSVERRYVSWGAVGGRDRDKVDID